MTHRIVHGLTFLCPSPSRWELVADFSDRPFSAITFTFDGATWLLEATMRAGHTITRNFPTREAAFDLFSSRQELSA